MKIENYNRQFEEEKTVKQPIYSNPHMIYGFKMRLMVYLNGCSKQKGTHMSVFFQLMKGELDDCMEWPFDKRVYFVLIHQDDKNRCYERLSDDAREKVEGSLTSFGKPVTDVNVARGFRDFVTLEKLHADGFIKNDVLYIRNVIE